jgi:beta-xylosidase
VKEMNKEGTKIISDGVMVYDGHEKDPTIEGPKFYKRNGHYYIFAPAGGVSTGWQTVLRSKNVYGPYERKVVMDQGTTSINGPHQGAWVTTQTGEDWFLHFQDKDAYGRVVHLQPMKWINEWPVIGVDKDGDGKGEPVLINKKPNVGKQYPRTTVQDSDEFSETKFGLQWQWQANLKEGWAFPTPNGSLRMFSVYQPDSIKSAWSYPNILAQKFPAEEFSVAVKISFKPKFENERFGLVIFGTDYAALSVIKKNDGVYIVQSENINADKNKNEIEISSMPVSGNEFYLKVKVSKGGICDLSYESEKGSGQLLKTFKAKPAVG